MEMAQAMLPDGMDIVTEQLDFIRWAQPTKMIIGQIILQKLAM